jgi:uncharacterized protein
MPTSFLHGAEVINIDNGPRPIQTVKTSVVGIIGTAPLADATKFPLNTPVLIPGSQAMLAFLGLTGTLPDAIRRIFTYAGAAIVVVRVLDNADINLQLSNLIGNAGLYTGINAFLRAKSLVGVTPKLLLAPGFTSQRPVGVNAITVGVGGTGYTTAPTVVLTGGGGTGAAATAVLTAGVVTSIALTAGGVGYTSAPVISFTGGGGTGATATATILALANPVMTGLNIIAGKLKAMVYGDAPADTNANALLWKADFNSRRIYPWAPLVKVWDTTTSAYIDKPCSPSIVGAQVWLDNNKGFWWSPSNKELTDIGGVSRPIEFRMGDPDCEANILNEARINTVINYDGWRSWGNRTCDTDANWVFASSVRIADAIDESILAAARPWIDQPLRPALITDIVESGNAYLRILAREGAIVGGKMWIDPDRNSTSELAAGQLHVEYDREPASPLERLTYGAQRNQTYYATLIQDVLSEINRASALAA